MSEESFEAEAELFYKDTGFLAPGKSEPRDCGQYDFERGEVRRLMKKAWDAGRHRSPASGRMARLEAVLKSVREDLKSDLEYRNDCLEHHTADCEVPGCEDPDECSKRLTQQRIAALDAQGQGEPEHDDDCQSHKPIYEEGPCNCSLSKPPCRHDEGRCYRIDAGGDHGS